ncbi:Peptidoglycan-binding domain 1 protein [Thalassoporum mexicanum PCC 7367]|uniref:peptidoglycan-binding domain-containing protein n=1 Tax=Thalassoporum mexicanum TaxID=3457544 RepID=UPI00029F9BA2|nr:peptidoglycan-binding protein [Pseudanabaena sp. PCC 7367]AFY69728.1 Peptidoglycan-binding domain 1 protein [Pseudanabaena sp. PCC 7367]
MELSAFLYSELCYERSQQGTEIAPALNCNAIDTLQKQSVQHLKTAAYAAVAVSTVATGIGIATPAALGYVPEIAELQELLATRGFSPGTIDGEIGPDTRAAIADAQTFYGVEVDGIVGAQTLAVLQADDYVAPNFGGDEGSDNLTGDDVITVQISNMQVQNLLAERGFYFGAIDGLIGAGTRQAIADAQAFYGISTDGVFGSCTYDTLRLDFAPNACLTS